MGPRRIVVVLSTLLAVAQGRFLLRGGVAAPPLLRVRGGVRGGAAARLEEGTTAAAAAAAVTVPPPAVLSDVDNLITNARRDAAAPDALHVFGQVLSYIWNVKLRDRLLLVASLSSLVLAKALNVLVPFTLKRAVDALEASGTASAMLPVHVAQLLGLYCLTRLGVSAANEARSIAYARLSQQASRRFATDLFQQFHALGADFHLENPTGALTVAFGRGVRGFQSLQFQLLYSIMPTLLELGLSASVLAQRFGKAGRTLGGVAVLTFTAYALWTAAIVERQIVLRKRLTRLDNAKAAFLVDSLAAQETVKLHNNELVETRRFDALLIAMQKLSVRSQLVGALLNAGQAAIFGTGLLISMLLAAQGFSRGQLSLGDVVAVNGLLLQLARPMDFMGYSVSEIRQSLVDMDTSLRTLATPTTTHTTGAAPRPMSEDAAAVGAAVDDGALHEAASAGAASAAGALGLARNLPLTAPEVRFENVSFAYNSSEPPVLHGVTFTAPAGGMTCLVGGSGSGKSTCLRLLARLREPTEGSRIILWGSLDLQTLPICAVRDRISYISQDPELFDDTLEWNLRYGNLAAPPAAVEAAAAAAELSSRVPGLGGYLMRVGERGARLSGGERQRVVVARALLRDAPLLLADEAASAVDAPTEAKLVEALRQGTRGSAVPGTRGSGGASAAGSGAGSGASPSSTRTLITVVHRLSAVTPAADHIVVFAAGRVVEQGTHTQLLTQYPTGEYARLWRAQQRQPEAYTDETVEFESQPARAAY